MNFKIWVVLAATITAATSATPLAAAPPIAATPMHTSSPSLIYPRLIKFPNAGVMARINALLAAQEKADRAAKTDCIAQLKEANQKPTADSYTADITVTYLSVHYLSINVVSAYDCGGPYPNAGIESPLTFDLDTGTAIDWAAEFKPGFLPPQGADENSPPAALTKLYRARYPHSKDDADCRSAIAEQDPFSDAPAFWLDAKRGLVVEPDLPHVIQACAEEMVLTPADLATVLKDAKLLADLRSTVNPPAGRK